ncbi:hypothetical protein BJX76DRAFT_349232 [Aspergillus varians]
MASHFERLEEGAASRPFKCNRCGKGYTKLEHLKVYPNEADTNSKPFRCERCGRRFGRQDVLSRHVKLHSAKSGSVDSTPQPVQDPLSIRQNELGQPVYTAPSELGFPAGPVAATPADAAPHITTFEDSDKLQEWLMAGFNKSLVPPLPPAGLSDFNNTLSPADLGLPGDQSHLVGSHRPEAMGIQQLFKSIDDMYKRLSWDIDRNGITSDFIDICLHEFFERVAPGFLVIHGPTFLSQRTIPPLMLNMVALGSLFVCLPNAVQKGELLWRLGHTAVATSWRTLIALRGPHDTCNGVQLVLTALLGQMYALLSSHAEIRTTAFVFHGLGFYWARTCGMFSMQGMHPSLPDRNASEADKTLLWEIWAAAEVQRRAVLGHYILDGLISQASGSPTSARHPINQIGTACSDDAFTASTVDEWIFHMERDKTAQMPMSMVYTALFDTQYINAPLNLSSFSVSVVIEGLQSLVSESNEVSVGTMGVIPRQQIVRAMLTIYRTHILFALGSERKVVRWHNVCLETAAPSTALYKALCGRFDISPLLGGVPGETAIRVFDVEHWATSADAIRALLHAIAIVRLLGHIPLAHSQAPLLPMAIFSSAMVISASCLVGRLIVEIPSSPRWEDVWEVGEAPPGRAQDADEFLRDLRAKAGRPVVSVNLVNELNFLQLALKTLTSCWGVSAQMERVVGRLTVLAHERHAGMRAAV